MLLLILGQASTSFIQRRFKVGYARAGRIIDQMEERGIISGYQGSKPREVLMSKEKWQELKMGTEQKVETQPQTELQQQTSEANEESKGAIDNSVTKTIEAVKKISEMNSSEKEY